MAGANFRATALARTLLCGARMRFLVLTLLALTACQPADLCESIPLGRSSAGLPLQNYVLDSQGGIFDLNFTPMWWSGPAEFRCCFGQLQGQRLSSCPAQLDCTDFSDAQVKAVMKPFSGGQGLGGYFCQVAIRDEKVVSVWGQYND